MSVRCDVEPRSPSQTVPCPLGHDSEDNLITRCSACHASVHGRYVLRSEDLFKESSPVSVSLQLLYDWPDRLEVLPVGGGDLSTGIQQVRLAVHGKNHHESRRMVRDQRPCLCDLSVSKYSTVQYSSAVP